jgi:hypothetical protein
MIMPISDFFNKPQPQMMRTTTPSTISSLYNPQTQSQPVKPTPAIYNLEDRGAKISDTDIEAFRPLLYGEVSNRNFDKKKLEADVILNTVLNRQKEYAKRGQNKSVSEILAMPNQYQAYGGSQYVNYKNPKDSISAAKKKEVDAIVDEIKERIKRGDYKDNTEGAYFYIHNPDQTITYDNLRPLFK